MKKIYIKIALLSFLILSAMTNHLLAQCNPASTLPVSFTSLSVTNETCPQSGTITVNGVSGGGGEYAYEIVSGPIIRAIQSQTTFSALSAGTYKVRVTGCNGRFKEGTATILNQYRHFADNYAGISAYQDQSKGLKCGNTTDGRAIIKQMENLYFPSTGYTPMLSDTQYIKWPLRYQITTNSNPYTGFNGVPYNNFPPRVYSPLIDYFGVNTPTVGQIITHADTLTGLTAGQTYYIRITDACGVFTTTSVSIAVPTGGTLGYDFQLNDPPAALSGSAKQGCVQTGLLKYSVNGSFVSQLPSNHSSLPLSVLITRQDNGSTIVSRPAVYSFYTPDGGTIFDSIPRVPIVVKITDACGIVTTFNKNPLPLPAFHIQAYSSCSNPRNFLVRPYDYQPSPIIQLKVYNSANTKIIDMPMTSYVPGSGYPPYNYNYQTLSLPLLPGEDSIAFAQYIPSYGIYHITYTDACGRTDSLTYDFEPILTPAPPPAFSFQTFYTPCTSNTKYTESFVQTTSSPLDYHFRLISGPAGVTYPRLSKGTLDGQLIFDSLVVGTYTMRVGYGCANTNYDTTFTVAAATPVTLTPDITYTPNVVTCNADVNNGTGVLSATLTGVNLYTMQNTPQVRFTQAPSSFLQKIGRTKNGSAVSLPFELGNYSGGFGYWIAGCSLCGSPYGTPDSATHNQYTLFAINELGGSYIGAASAFDRGTYTLEMYDKCSGATLKSYTFTVNFTPYDSLRLGASAAYVCDDNSTVKLVASPRGGNPAYNYQIKLSTDPDEAYTAVQTDSLFILPSGTAVGSVYVVRAVDACGRSFVGRVPVNSFTGKLYVFPSNNCIGATAKIITGFIPGATYTWTKPNGTTIVTGSNELTIPSFGPSDVGTYTVSVNALNGCIVRNGSAVILSDCLNAVAVSLLSFTAAPQADNVLLHWNVNMEVSTAKYIVQQSTDALNYKDIGTVTATGSTGYNFTHYTPAAGINYYRLKITAQDGSFTYSDVKKVLFNGKSDVSIFPNPASSSVSIVLTSATINKAATVQLVSADGKIVLQKKVSALSQTETLDVSGLAAGSYMIRIVTTNEVVNKAFQVVHH